MTNDESSKSIAAFSVEVVALVTLCRDLFDTETLSGVLHYLNHNEPEMALEGLLIELFRVNRYPEPFDVQRWKRVVQSADFSDGGVFDEAILDHFERWIERATLS
ncbi:hypothetical protein FYZ48_17220 [Gimesia chilikensis]|uniref:hypothetical protein n=1 Tax=Gimesia chilikensis TaxID=2605989 RepID=UPI0011EE1026|nr:hypothetical protein [Gimesia chilikensis]KAA0135870.1 hypothetical protein FYZ48_17220 [Gimesia chilikensis]